MVMEIARVDTMFVVEAIVEADVVLAIVEGIGLLENGVIRSGGVRVRRGQSFHSRVDCSNSFPVSSQQAGRNYVTGKATGTNGCSLDGSIWIENRSNAGVSCVCRIPQSAVIGGANDAIRSSQT